MGKLSDDELMNVFGGKKRLQRLNEHFALLCANNIELAIISFGFVHIIKQALQRMDLFNAYFAKSIIIGKGSQELSNAFGSKAECIKQTFVQSKKRKIPLTPMQILFVDDDEDNTEEADEMNICQTITVKQRKGMTDKHMLKIEEMIADNSK